MQAPSRVPSSITRGTKAVWAFKYGGKYYAFYDAYDSDKLGVALALMIPRDHDELREWLATTRRDLAELDQRLEQAWTVSVDSPAESKDICSIAGTEALALAPSPFRPGWDLRVQFVYVVDLDRQTLVRNYVCHFWLDRLPDAKNLGPLMEPANRYWLGLDQEPADACITTDAAVPPPIVDADSAETEYAALEPLPMPETTQLDDKTEALVSAMNDIHRFVCDMYSVAIWQALESCSAESHVFRELCYLLLSVACCSPERIRLANTNADAVADARRPPSDLVEALRNLHIIKYGILSGGSRHLVSSFLGGYHEAGKAPGSAPPDTSYWIGPVLVRLERDLSCRTRFRAAISAAVRCGRAEKQEFRVVVFSLRHFVLIHVGPLGVRHSKRHHLPTDHLHVERSYFDKVSRPRAAMDMLNHGGPEDQDWVAHETCDGFRALARFMILSSSEINRALEEFDLSEPFELMERGEDEPELLRVQGVLRGKSFHSLLSRLPGGRRLNKGRTPCVLVLAAGSKTSTASFMAMPVPWEPVLPRFMLTTAAPEPVPVPADWPETMLDRLDLSEMRRDDPFSAQWRRTLESTHTNWTLLETLLTSADAPLITCYALSLAVLYGLAFFLPLGIAGSGAGLMVYQDDLCRVRLGQLARQSLGSHVQMAGRSEGNRRSIYFLALYRPASDDSAEGWARAEKEARKQAELEYIRDAFRLWIDNKDTATRDLAIYIIVGTKFKVLHVTKHPQIPTMEQAPPGPGLSLDQSSYQDEDPFWRPWEGTSISARDLRAQLEFGPVDAMFDNRGSAVDEHLGHLQPLPFDVQELDDHPAIDAALAWTQMLANSRGPRPTDRFLAPHPYHI